MAWDPQISKAFLKTFGQIFLGIVGVPGTLVLLSVSFGLKPNEQEINVAWNGLQQYGPAFFALLVVGVALYTTHKLVGSDRLNYEKTFYQENSQARLEQAYYVFFHLYQEGKSAKAGTPLERQEWDKKLQRELRRYCNEQTVGLYLANTSRYEPGSDSRPLPEDKLDYALEFIWKLLQTKFDHFFKT